MTATAALPGVLPGDYKVIVAATFATPSPRATRTNNFGASTQQLQHQPAIAYSRRCTGGTLTQGNSVYYRVDVPAGETLLVNFDSSSTTASRALRSLSARMPTRSVFDYAFTNQFSPDQKVVRPSSQGGTYYILAYGDKSRAIRRSPLLPTLRSSVSSILTTAPPAIRAASR